MEQMTKALRQGSTGGKQGQGGAAGSTGAARANSKVARWGRAVWDKHPLRVSLSKRAQGGSGRTSSAMNSGDRQFPDTGIRARLTRLRGAGTDLPRRCPGTSPALRRELRENRDLSGDVGDLIREMQNLDPARFKGNPELVEQLRAQLLPMLEQIELRLRRELDAEQGGQVRSGLSQEAPAGYGRCRGRVFPQLEPSAIAPPSSPVIYLFRYQTTDREDDHVRTETAGTSSSQRAWAAGAPRHPHGVRFAQSPSETGQRGRCRFSTAADARTTVPLRVCPT